MELNLLYTNDKNLQAVDVKEEFVLKLDEISWFGEEEEITTLSWMTCGEGSFSNDRTLGRPANGNFLTESEVG